MGTQDALPQRNAGEIDHLELALPRTDEAPGTARRRLARWLTPRLADSELHKAMLLTSELVTNAVIHGQGEIIMRAYLDEDRVLVEVIDQGHGFERVLREQDFERIGGHGLSIVDAESSRWGIDEGTTHVWFELERPGPRLGAADKPLE
jgi:anti-sigma regulatory factor (Ser/Thr protein kinase)